MTDLSISQDHHFDLAILGAGSGGMAAARRARDYNLSVVLFERGRIGGTCVNAGCVPKKLLVHASRVRDTLDAAACAGWRLGEAAIDWPALRDAVGAETARLANGHRARLLDMGVRIIDASAAIERPGRVRTQGDQRFAAREIVVATGAAPIVPDLPGAELALVSDDIFRLDALPSRLGVVGGGYIASEFACLLHRLGVAVTVYESGERLLNGFDAEVGDRLTASMLDQGIDVRTGVRIAALSQAAGGTAVQSVDGKRDTFDRVLLAVGRRPATDGLGLEAAGVRMTRRGGVAVDATGCSSVPGIRAIGDAADHMMLTPLAVADGRDAVDDILGHALEGPDRAIIPTAAFTTPECGSVGMTEKAATAQGVAHEVRRKTFVTLTSAISARPGAVLMKAVVSRPDGRLLGFHFFGPHAAEATQMAAVALAAGLTEAELARTMALHPSTAEEMIALGDPDGPIHPTLREIATLAAD